MPISDVDIYQAANLLIRRYGPQAHREAIQRPATCSCAVTLTGTLSGRGFAAPSSTYR